MDSFGQLLSQGKCNLINRQGWSQVSMRSPVEHSPQQLTDHLFGAYRGAISKLYVDCGNG